MKDILGFGDLPLLDGRPVAAVVISNMSVLLCDHRTYCQPHLLSNAHTEHRNYCQPYVLNTALTVKRAY